MPEYTSKFTGEEIDERLTAVTDKVGKEDYATTSDAGIGKVSATYGTGMTSSQIFCTSKATDSDISAGKSNYKPIVPSNLSVAMSEYGISSKTLIPDMSETTSKATTHIADSTLHVTETDKSNWNAKASKSEFKVHTENRDIHTTADSQESWNNAAESAALSKSTIGYQRKNQLKNTAVSRTINGINLTVNDDGSMTFNAGTSTGLVSQIISKFTFKAGVSYIITGAPDDGTKTTRITLVSDDGTEYSDSATWDTGSGGTVKFDSDATYNIRARVCVANTTLSEAVVFKPMVRIADISDNTYEAYAPGVDERLEELETAVNANQNKLIFSGTSAAKVTLSESAENYDLLTIQVDYGTGYHFITAASAGVTQAAIGTTPTYGASATKVTIGSCLIYVSGNSVEISMSPYNLTSSGSSVTTETTSTAKITKVFGHKYTS
jgi:hypothetical protein